MNKINFYFERNKCDLIWTILLVIIGIIFFLYYNLYLIYKIFSNYENISFRNNDISIPSLNNEVVKDKTNSSRNNDISIPSQNNEIIIRYHQNREEKNSKETLNQSKKEEAEINIENKKIEDEKKQHTCVVCMINETKVILCPCGYKCICEDCYNLLNSSTPKNCPICRNNFIGKIDHVFSIY